MSVKLSVILSAHKLWVSAKVEFWYCFGYLILYYCVLSDIFSQGDLFVALSATLPIQSVASLTSIYKMMYLKQNLTSLVEYKQNIPTELKTHVQIII